MKRTGIDLDLVPNIQNWKGSRFVVAPGDLDLPRDLDLCKCTLDLELLFV